MLATKTMIAMQIKVLTEQLAYNWHDECEAQCKNGTLNTEQLKNMLTVHKKHAKLLDKLVREYEKDSTPE